MTAGNPRPDMYRAVRRHRRISMAMGNAGKLEAVPLRVTHKERIPAKRYYDREFFELERERLWPHVWQMACRLEEIPNIGDFVEYEILDKSVIVVRTKSSVKAFHNTCRHRGVQFAKGRGNCRVKGFNCPFHGWRWNIDGENTFVLGRHVFSEENLQQAEINLVPCRVELWGGSAFINFDNNAPPLIESLGPVAQRLSSRNVDKLKMEWWYQTVLPTNWKLAMEAFMEGYHTMRTHPQLHSLSMPEANPFGPDPSNPLPTSTGSTEELVDLGLRFLERLGDGMAGMVHRSEVAIAKGLKFDDLPKDIPTAAGQFYERIRGAITADGQARGLPVPDLNALAQNQSYVEFMFPHYFLLPFFSAMASYRIRPLTPETCLFEIWSLAFLPEDEQRKPVLPTVLPYNSKEFPEIPRQDYSNLPLQQLGLHGVGFEYMRLSNKVEGMISNYQRLIDGYLAGLDQQTLCNASQAVNTGYDAPIVEIGF
jgi:phenylpropionate dioxygenase-like ring-hydroxylating dioxygenase large terminal subunit